MPEELQDSIEGQEPASESSPEVQDAQGEESSPPEEKIPWNKDKRWQEWQQQRSEYQELKGKLPQLEQQNKQYQQQLYENIEAIKWFQTLSQNPDLLERVRGVVSGKDQQTQNDPYSKYDETAAEKFRRLDQLEKQFSELTQTQEQERQQYQLEQNKLALESEFDRLCKDSKVPEHQKKAMAVYTIQAIQELLQGQDPRTASKQAVAEAFKMAKPILDNLIKAERSSLTIPQVPASGSKTGIPARQQYAGGPEDRIKNLMGAMES